MSLDPKYLELEQEVEAYEESHRRFTFNERYKEWVVGLLILIAKILLYKI